MNVNLYKLTDVTAGRPVDGSLAIHWWEPHRDGLPRAGARRPVNYFWWALATFGGFARDGFAEMRIERAGRVLHRLIVTPRWYRFPFMAEADLQVGGVWTAAEARRQGLAAIGLAEAHRRYASACSALWYVTEAANEPSQALARSCGYRHVATGRRRRRLGSGLFGQYVIDRFI